MSDAASGMYDSEFSATAPPPWGWGGGPGVGSPKSKPSKRGGGGSGPEWGYGGGPVIGGSKRIDEMENANEVSVSDSDDYAMPLRLYVLLI